jgi:hypothetical protein
VRGEDLRASVNADGIANRVRMKRLKHAGAFLLVEGEDDKKLFKNFVDTASCIIQIAYGKPNVLGALAILEQNGFRGVLAIADADFAHLEGQPPRSPNLVWTDTHDLETMLLASPALDRLLSERGDEDKLADFMRSAGSDVRAMLLKLGTSVGYLRWLSQREAMSLFFDDLPFDEFLNEKTLALNEGALLRVLQSRSRKGVLIEADIRAKIALLKSVEHDPWQVCCGHDLVSVVSIALLRVFGANKEADVKPGRLEESLRLAFTAADFKGTRLWTAIRAWEDQNPPFLVLAAVAR